MCFWQYDEVAHKQSDILIGINKISLKEAKENYKKYGVCKKDFLEYVRETFEEEK